MYKCEFDLQILCLALFTPHIMQACLADLSASSKLKSANDIDMWN